MKKTELKEAFYIDRKDVLENPFYSDMLFSLIEYYESGQWLCHYELDEKGLLPKGIKRGVLSQDELFNFLEELAQYKTDM